MAKWLILVLLLAGCGAKGAAQPDIPHEVPETLDTAPPVDNGAGEVVSTPDMSEAGPGEDVYPWEDVTTEVTSEPDDADPHPGDIPLYPETEPALEDLSVTDVTGEESDTTEGCIVLPPLEPFTFWVEGGGAISMDALVVRKGPGPAAKMCGDVQCREVELLLVTGETLLLTYALPDNLEIPVYPHQWVHVFFKEDKPWWTDRYLVLWKLDWDFEPVFFIHNASWTGSPDCGGYETCPGVHQLPSECEPAKETCGEFTHPPVEIAVAGGVAILEQGQSSTDEARRIRYLLARSHSATQMMCLDYPSTWVAAAAIRNSDVSQCRCKDHGDCRPGDACASDTGHCVPDLCGFDGKCADGWCDAFTGECAKSLTLCNSDADCDPTEICHPAMVRCVADKGCTFERGCRDNYCTNVDCPADSVCSHLLRACVRCVADCDCPKYGDGGWCDSTIDGGVCRECDLTKVHFSQANTGDFFTICASQKDFSLEALQAVDPDVSCTGMSHGYAKCDKDTEIACWSSILTSMKSVSLDDAAWGRACAFASLPWVSRIGLGFWE